MEAAAANLTPVVLELGGKDAFIVCEDADLNQVLPTAMRGAFQSCGQNCAGAERFIVHERVHDEFVRRAAEATAALRQGPASGPTPVDCGAMCMPGAAEAVQQLVDDAVRKGAKVMAGGVLPPKAAGGQFYPPTVLTGVTPAMRIWQEEVFGPVMAVVKFSGDDEAVAIANDCPFGLGSSVFSGSRRRARAIAAQLEVCVWGGGGRVGCSALGQPGTQFVSCFAQQACPPSHCVWNSFAQAVCCVCFRPA
jgi:acyl-CoA reductase-like NAD-dependent aldehyde dehydrogenase